MIMFLFVIVVLGCALYLVETYVPMAEPIKVVLRILVVLIIVWYLLSLIGLVPKPVL